MGVIFAFSKPISSSDFVFTRFNNQSGFENQSYVAVIGLLSSLYAFSGYEAGATMAEETTNAHENAPKSIVYSVVLSSITGIAFIAAVLFGCQENIDAVVSGKSDHAIVNLFALVFPNRRQIIVVLTLIIVLNIFLSGFSNLTVTSRVGFAMARDGAFPLAERLRRINPETKSPDMIILLVSVLASLLCLLPLVSTTAFTAITSIATIGV